MKIYLKYIFLFLIAGSIFSSCNQKDEKVYSFWALQNRATGEYLYEDDGECKFSREKQGDKSLWKIAAAEGDHVCIVNKKSGRYLSLDNGQVVCSVVDQPVTESAEWYYGNFDFVTQTNSGWYTISNRSAESNLHLVEKDGTLCMQDNANRNTDFSAHWTWVREEGTPCLILLLPMELRMLLFREYERLRLFLQPRYTPIITERKYGNYLRIFRLFRNFPLKTIC